MSGQVIGIATFTVTDGQALNFAIPSNVLLNLSSDNAPTKLSDIQTLLSKKLSTSTVKASANPCLRFLPNDWWLVGNLHCKAYFDLIDKFGSDMEVVQYAEMLKGTTGIDIRNEVQYVTFFISGNPDLNPQFLITVKGTFDNAISEMRLKLGFGVNMQTTTYRDTKLYENPEIGYCFPEESTFMIGSPNILRSSIDVLTQRTKLLPSSLHRILENTNGASIIWLVVKPNVILNMEGIKEEKQNYPDIFKRISAIEYSSLFFESTHNGFLASALAYLPEQNSSKELHNYLRERKRNLLNVEGANVFLCLYPYPLSRQKTGVFKVDSSPFVKAVGT